MRLIVAICCVCAVLFSAAALRHPDSGLVPSITTALANAQATGTELMQQSDHHRRVEQAKKAEDEDRQIAAFGVPEATTRDYDYLVLILLAASVVILASVARRNRRARFRL